MKKTWKTYASQTNWPVDNEYEDKGNDQQKELFLNAYWEECGDRLRLDILEEVDRKIEWLYGRTFSKLNILSGWFHLDIADPFDVLVDRYMKPWDLNSAKRITHVGIYQSLSDIASNPMFDQEAVTKLKQFFATKAGLIQAGQNALIAADRAQRMLDLGVPDVLLPILGETYVELNEMQYRVWDADAQEDEVRVCITANANQILMDKPMKEILGVNMYTWASWAGDVEATDLRAVPRRLRCRLARYRRGQLRRNSASWV
jgi:hypothetical protein